MRFCICFLFAPGGPGFVIASLVARTMTRLHINLDSCTCPSPLWQSMLTNRVSNVAQDVFDAITRFISSPPGQLAAGGVLAGIVWKFFERIEAILTEETKLRIAVWLLGLEISKTVEPWPQTFVRIFDRVFGYKHFSLKC